MSGLFELRELRAIVDGTVKGGALAGEGPTKEEMQTALQALFVHQCLYAWTLNVGRSYQLLVTYSSYFERVLDAMGRGLKVDPRSQMVAMTVETAESRFDRRYSRLKLDETMVLLGLRLAYEEGIEDRRIDEFGAVELTTDELMDRLQALAPDFGIKEARLHDILVLFRRKGFIRMGDYDRSERVRVIEIMPGIDIAAPGNITEEIHAWAETLSARRRSGKSPKATQAEDAADDLAENQEDEAEEVLDEDPEEDVQDDPRGDVGQTGDEASRVAGFEEPAIPGSRPGG